MIDFRVIGFIGALCLSGCAHESPPVFADEVVRTEREFATFTRQHGIPSGFRTYAAANGLLFRPDPVNARARFAGQPSTPGKPLLEWRPLYAAMSVSNDLGFTVGSSLFDGKVPGYFFTVWARQPDGRLRWLLDHGFSSEAAATIPADEAIFDASPVRSARRGAETALREIGQIEEDWAAKSAEGDAHPERLWLAGDAWSEAKFGRHYAAAVVRRGPIRLQPIARGASRQGDLAYSYGHAAWTEPAGAKRGHYVRLWRRTGPKWEILFSEIVPIAVQ